MQPNKSKSPTFLVPLHDSSYMVYVPGTVGWLHKFIELHPNDALRSRVADHVYLWPSPPHHGMANYFRSWLRLLGFKGWIPEGVGPSQGWLNKLPGPMRTPFT